MAPLLLWAWRRYDWGRTARLTVFQGLLMGPLGHIYYSLLDGVRPRNALCHVSRCPLSKLVLEWNGLALWVHCGVHGARGQAGGQGCSSLLRPAALTAGDYPARGFPASSRTFPGPGRLPPPRPPPSQPPRPPALLPAPLSAPRPPPPTPNPEGRLVMSCLPSFQAPPCKAA